MWTKSITACGAIRVLSFYTDSADPVESIATMVVWQKSIFSSLLNLAGSVIQLQVNVSLLNPTCISE